MSRLFFAFFFTFSCLIFTKSYGQEFSFSWDCPQSLPSSVSKALPSSKRVLLNGDQTERNNQIRSFFEPMNSGQVNYSKCISLLLSTLRQYTSNDCKENVKPDTCIDLKNETIKEIESILDLHTSKEEREFLYPAQVPLESNPIAEPRYEDTISKDLKHCTVPSNLSREFVEVDFLKMINLHALSGTEESKKCMMDQLEDLVHEVSSVQVPSVCLEKMKSSAICKNYLKRIYELEDLTNLYIHSFNEDASFNLSHFLYCTEKQNKKNEIQKLLTEIEQPYRCNEYQIGQPKFFNNNKIKIEKTSENNFDIRLNLQFSPSDSFESVVKDAEGNTVFEIDPKSVGINYRMKTQFCLEEAKRGLKGPNGEQITIQFSDADKHDVKPTHIKIGGMDHRSNSIEWRQSIDCPTILHEILHLFNLSDEYSERKVGYTIDPKTKKPKLIRDIDSAPYYENEEGFLKKPLPGFDCRIIGPEESIMRFQNSAYKKFFGYFSQRWGCACLNKSDSSCYDILKNAPMSRCPEGTVPAGVQPYGNPKIDNNDSSIRIVGTYFPSEGGRNSLLFPAHFKQILYPECLERNKKYIDCKEQAYKTSLERNGEGCDPLPELNCPSNSSLWLLEWNENEEGASK